MTILKKIIIVLTVFFITITIGNTEVIKDKVVAIVNNKVILDSDIKKQIRLLKLLVNIDGAESMKSFTLKDIIAEKIQIPISKRKKVIVKDTEVRDIFLYFASRNELRLADYKKLIVSYNLTPRDVKYFLKNSLMIEKVHEKVLSKKLNVTKREFVEFLDFSNHINYKEQTTAYTFLHIIIENNKKNKNNLIKKVIKALKNEKNEEKALKILANKKLNTKVSLVKMRPKKNIKSFYMFLINNIDKKVVGPLHSKKKLHIFKLLKKKSVLDKQEDTVYKIAHFTIKKKIIDINTAHVDNFKKKLKILNVVKNKVNKNRKTNTYNKYFKELWITGFDLSDVFFKNICYLEKNETSEIFETETGWHLVILIDKKISKKTNTYNTNISSAIGKRLTRFREIWLSNIKTNTYIKIYSKCGNLRKN